MQIQNSYYCVKFSSALHKADVFQFISSGFFQKILGEHIWGQTFAANCSLIQEETLQIH